MKIFFFICGIIFLLFSFFIIDLIENHSFVINPNTPITLSLTLPDSHIVFHSFIKNDLFDKENLWLLPYMD